MAVGVELGDQTGGRILVARRASADEENVVEEGAAKGAVEEMIGQGVLLRHLPQGRAAAVVIAHGQTGGV